MHFVLAKVIYTPKVIEYKSFTQFILDPLPNNSRKPKWEENKFGNWKISEIENPNYVIGFGGLSNRKYGDQLKLNLGFRFDKLYWGKGYATEFARDAIKYGFNELNKKYIYGLVRPKNLASVKVLEKCNMLVFDTLSDVPDEEDSLVYRINKNQITDANKS